jgi:homoserine O-acetyltransferase
MVLPEPTMPLATRPLAANHLAVLTPGAAPVHAAAVVSGPIDAAAATASPRLAAQRGVLCLDLPLRHAGNRRVRVPWECVGPIDAPCVLVAGGISAGRHVAASAAFPERGWWDAQAGAGRPLDPARVRVLAIDWLGADGALDAPLDSADQADAIAGVLDALGIARLAAFVGCSYGAMVGLQFAARHGTRLGRLVAVSGGHRAHPYARAWRALQRRIAQLGRAEGASREGLALARQLAMLGYRTPAEFATRFDAAPVLVDGRACDPADAWLGARGDDYVARTTPTAFLRLSESIDLHAVDAARVRVPTTLVAVREDQLVPLDDLVRVAEALPALRRLHVLRSVFGHDAFLKEVEAIGAILEAALREAFAAERDAGDAGDAGLAPARVARACPGVAA